MNREQALIITSFSQEPFNFTCPLNERIILPPYSRIGLKQLIISPYYLLDQGNMNAQGDDVTGDALFFICLQGLGSGNNPAYFGIFGENQKIDDLVLAMIPYDVTDDGAGNIGHKYRENHQFNNPLMISLNNANPIELDSLTMVIRTKDGTMYSSDTFIDTTEFGGVAPGNDSALAGATGTMQRVYAQLIFDTLPNLSTDWVKPSLQQDMRIQHGEELQELATDITNDNS
tara:strand:- start:10773 stop:11462 length:690 start_codon:yes stop_codon:yes gene_type:complete